MEKNNEGQENLDPKHIMSKIREGYKQDLSFKIGGYDCPCRILSAEAEAAAIAKGKLEASKMPATADKKLSESIKVQKQVLFAGTQVGTTNYLPLETIDNFSADELAKIYDKYRSTIKLADPEFELLSMNEIDDMIFAVKKKGATWRDFYISDLAGMGKYFLEQIIPKGSGPGS